MDVIGYLKFGNCMALLGGNTASQSSHPLSSGHNQRKHAKAAKSLGFCIPNAAQTVLLSYCLSCHIRNATGKSCGDGIRGEAVRVAGKTRDT